MTIFDFDYVQATYKKKLVYLVWPEVLIINKYRPDENNVFLNMFDNIYIVMYFKDNIESYLEALLAISQ